MTRRIPAVCVVLVLLGAVPATAQTAQQVLLKGVVDFSSAIEDLGKGLPQRIKDAVSKAFPISERKKLSAQEFQFGNGGIRLSRSSLTR